MTRNKKLSWVMTSKRLFLGGRLLLGVIFLFASIDKIHHPVEFAKIIYNYQILSGTWINLAAVILPWVELLLGLFLISGIWIPGALLLCNLILTIFLGLLVFNLYRGLNVSCGCFSTDPSQMASAVWDIFRDGFFLSLAIYLLINNILHLNNKRLTGSQIRQWD